MRLFRMRYALPVGIALCALVLATRPPAAIPQGGGKTLHVDGSRGDDSVGYEQNSAERPWKTIGRAAWGSTNRDATSAAQAARAGDVVLVAAGTYAAAGSNSRNVPVYQPANSGTAGRPITFKAQGVVNLTLTSGRGSVIGSFERHHITWDGFTIHEATAPSHPDTGPVTIWLCDGCVLQNLDINGNGNDNGRGDNHTGIRIELSRNVVARNNRIQNVYSGANPNNGAGIMTYSSGGLLFEHNEIFKCGSGIFLKGGGKHHPNRDSRTIRYNLLYDIGERQGGGAASGSAIALHGGAASTLDQPTRIYQNLLLSSLESAIRLWMFDGVSPFDNPMHVKIVNNTIHDAQYAVSVTNGGFPPDAGNVFRNNIVAGAREFAVYSEAPESSLKDKQRFDSEHNLFFQVRDFTNAGGRGEGLGSWKRAFKQDAADPASQATDPRFVDAAARNYRLQPGSPARQNGVDYLDLNGNGSTTDRIPVGAYLTGEETIGRMPALRPTDGRPANEPRLP